MGWFCVVCDDFFRRLHTVAQMYICYFCLCFVVCLGVFVCLLFLFVIVYFAFRVYFCFFVLGCLLFFALFFFQTIGLGETRWHHYSSCSSYR